MPNRQPCEPCQNCNKVTHSEDHFISPRGNVYCDESCYRERAASDMEFLADWKRENHHQVDQDQEAFNERIKDL